MIIGTPLKFHDQQDILRYRERMLSFVMGVVSAVLLSVAVDVLTGGVTKGLRRLRLRWASSTALQVDTSADGLFMLGEWSPVRQLHPHRLSTIELSKPERPVQSFVDEEVFAGAVARCHQDTGEIAYITSFR